MKLGTKNVRRWAFLKIMNITRRIRSVAAKKIKVTITNRVRSRGGFYVWYPVMKEEGGPPKMLQGCATARTKKEAYQILFAKLRCFQAWDFEISVRPPHVGDKPHPKTGLRKEVVTPLTQNGMDHSLIKPVADLRALRLSMGWTQQQCAKLLGASYHSLRSWEAGVRKPTAFGQREILSFIKRHQ
jgi:DNA-binding transcriptional regulator YiaG